MSVVIISPHEWKKQKWKNGGGITNEVYSKSAAQGILWRISIADVSSSGPFSIFPGIQRTILLLEGNGFNLKFANNSQKLISKKFVPFRFAGKEEIQCDLIDGPVRDFNLMTRRDKVNSVFKVFNLAAEADVKLEPSSKVILHIAEGQASVIINREEYHLEHGYTLLCSRENTDMHLSGVGAVAFVIYLDGEDV